MKPYKIAVQRARKLMQIYIKHIPKDIRPILVIDHTSWPRPDAVTLQERTIEHQATDIPGNRPLTLGQGYSRPLAKKIYAIIEGFKFNPPRANS